MRQASGEPRTAPQLVLLLRQQPRDDQAGDRPPVPDGAHSYSKQASHVDVLSYLGLPRLATGAWTPALSCAPCHDLQALNLGLYPVLVRHACAEVCMHGDAALTGSRRLQGGADLEDAGNGRWLDAGCHWGGARKGRDAAAVEQGRAAQLHMMQALRAERPSDATSPCGQALPPWRIRQHGYATRIIQVCTTGGSALALGSRYSLLVADMGWGPELLRRNCSISMTRAWR